MITDIYDPLAEYVNVYRDRFKVVAKDTFDQLAQEANVDVEANRKTCRELYKTEKGLSSAKSRLNLWTFGCALLWIDVAACVTLIILCYDSLSTREWIICLTSIAVALLLLFWKVHPRMKKLKAERNDLDSKVKELKKEAWEQMEPLNQLYDWDVLTRMMSQTVPRLEFDPYFTTQRLADLQATYNWDDSFNDERSVIYSHSGLINGNPFVLCRTRKMEWGTKTYHGSKTITWTTRERGADGRYHTEHHSETLRATVTAPYPGYYEKTRLIYGNTAAPDLTFYRQQNGLAGKEKSWTFKLERRALRKKARNLKEGDFAMMTNEDFEVAFNTSNRNNNQQFALLFTPLAQVSMLNLLKDKEAGYGDDFDFEKDKMINTIIPNHMQELNLDMNPEQFRHFDYDKAVANFQSINANYFRAIYFSLAPLLCVPMYQQIRPLSDIYGRDMKRHSSFWEHEALANFWGQERFKHPDCVTDCILKTSQVHDGEEDDSTLIVSAYGYCAVERLTYVSVWGGDGRSHRVPVYWDEYLPVTGQGTIKMKEDNVHHAPSTTQSQRLKHINNVLKEADLNVYRRNIASSI